MKTVKNIVFVGDVAVDLNDIQTASEIVNKAMNELQDMIESVDAYDGREALEMLDRVYGFVRSYTGRQSIAERRPELVGFVSGGGNRKEDLE